MGGVWARGTTVQGPVKVIQDRLIAEGFMSQDDLAGGGYGVFGPKTEKAVKAFQEASGLSTDGEVGPDTWAALEGEYEPVAPPK